MTVKSSVGLEEAAKVMILRGRVQTVLGYKPSFDAFYLLQNSLVLKDVPAVKNEAICHFYLSGQAFSGIIMLCWWRPCGSRWICFSLPSLWHLTLLRIAAITTTIITKYISTFNPHNSLMVCAQLSTFYKCRNKVAQRGQVTWPSHTSPSPSEWFVRSENLVISHSFLNLSMTACCLKDKAWFLQMTQRPFLIWPLCTSPVLLFVHDALFGSPVVSEHACVLSQSVMSDFVTPWTVACQTPLHGIFQAGILEWVAISYFRGPSWPRDWTRISCLSFIGRQILYHCTTWEALVFWTHDTILCLFE